ncbi:RidA family protein [Denitrobaculum tricleocarpae]|uniref:RidA family protein n=1 Tax=Denitrobaculum tricleocarpae TaxID=2591009 RepID=A0A545TRS7_9PROT|nr:RidA family protein [Denitrobaculum tricleocarpae]TQV79924.1 RidA family protein [Denitrobaculum tricleocarpae]
MSTASTKFITPEGIAPPASNYSHGAVVTGSPRRLVIAGQVGLDPDGTLAGGIPGDMAAQMERCWQNIFAILESEGMTKEDLIKITVYVTQADATGLYREIRDRMLDGHAPAATYVVVAGLAAPDFLVEIEGEAVAS